MQVLVDDPRYRDDLIRRYASHDLEGGMPIYEYVCQSCQVRFEVKQKVSDPPVSGCVRCGQAVTKVISAPAIMFKGGGWYVTDYSDKLKAPTTSEPGATNDHKDQKSATPTTNSASTTNASSASTPTSAGPFSSPTN